MSRNRAFLYLLTPVVLVFSLVFLGVPAKLTATAADGAAAAASEAALTIINLTAAGYDSDANELLLIGLSDGNWPGVDRAYVNENLLLTLRAAYNNPIEWPGVTIEFEPQPSPGHLPVFYFGQTDNTRHGQVTFEADRLLKSYGLGKDNVTEADMSSGAGCYTSVLDKLAELQQQNYQPGPVAPQRFFFEPDMQLDITPDGTAVTITQSRMILNWAYIPPDTSDRTPNATAAAQYFVDCFNASYDVFAAEQAAAGNNALYELRVLGEIAAIAKWIQDNQLDSANGKLDGIHYPWLNAYTNRSVTANTTTTATPAITVSVSFTVGNSTITQSLYGGVDMGGRPNSYRTNANANQLFIAAKAAAPPGAPPPYEWECGTLAANSRIEPQAPVSPVCVAFVEPISNNPVLDSNFLQVPSPWTAKPPANISNGQAHVGLNGSIEQTVTVPSDPNPTTLVSTSGVTAETLLYLTFDWAVAPPDPNPGSTVDFLYARLREADRDLITTLFSINNRTQPVLTWQTASFDVSTLLQNYLGQPIIISFESETAGETVFVIDNVYLDSNPFPASIVGPFDRFLYLPAVMNLMTPAARQTRYVNPLAAESAPESGSVLYFYEEVR